MKNSAPWLVPERDGRASDRVQFSIKKNGVSVSACVPAAYFDEHVLPVVSKLLAEIRGPASGRGSLEELNPAETSDSAESAKQSPLSVKVVAQKLSARTAPQILKAAAISLRVLHDREQFSWEELLAEAQRAHGFWRKSHSESATSILDWLLSAGTLIETVDGRYALSADEEAAAIALLA